MLFFATGRPKSSDEKSCLRISLSPEHLEHIFFTRYRTPVAKLFGILALSCIITAWAFCSHINCMNMMNTKKCSCRCRCSLVLLLLLILLLLLFLLLLLLLLFYYSSYCSCCCCCRCRCSLLLLLIFLILLFLLLFLILLIFLVLVVVVVVVLFTWAFKCDPIKAMVFHCNVFILGTMLACQ